jgi:prepilin-type processing-associated H-X9-DG protein
MDAEHGSGRLLPARPERDAGKHRKNRPCYGLTPFQQPKTNQDTGKASHKPIRRLTHSSQTVAFACGIMAFPTDPKGWHRVKASGNILFADNHVAFYQRTASTNLIW